MAKMEDVEVSPDLVFHNVAVAGELVCGESPPSSFRQRLMAASNSELVFEGVTPGGSG